MKIQRKAAAAAAIASIVALSSAAHAGGLLGDIFVRPFSPTLADQLDEAHKLAGSPGDVAVNAATKVLGVPLTSQCKTADGVVQIGSWGPVGTACDANGKQGVRVQ